jgi:hypothetical protein
MRKVIGFSLTVVAVAGVTGSSILAQDLQQKLAGAKESAAHNQQVLRTYTWVEKTELSLKGEVKNTKIESCRYGPDGKVQKTPMTEPPAPQKKQRGLKGKVIEKKTGEMKEELEATAALIHQYIPPAPDKMQVVMNAGGASAVPSGANSVTLKFADYNKKGDALTLTFEKAVKMLRQIAVATWLDKPDEPVSLKVTMEQLPDGTSHPGTIVLSIPSSKLEVRITNSNYQKVG